MWTSALAMHKMTELTLMMADHKRSRVWSCFTSQSNDNEAVCDVCSGTLRFCGDTTNCVKHLRYNHSTEHDEVMMMQQRSEEEKVRSTSITDFGIIQVQEWKFPTVGTCVSVPAYRVFICVRLERKSEVSHITNRLYRSDRQNHRIYWL